MSKRPFSSTSVLPDAKRTKPSGTTAILPPRNSFRGLPLELRDEIFAHVFDDLTAEPEHPYSDFPLNSRFEDYIALLLVDKATGEEAKRVFSKNYAKRIIFYFEDACTLFDLRRRWEEESFPLDVKFVLRTRSDLDPRMELDEGIQWMNEMLFFNPHHRFDEHDMGMVGLVGLGLHDGEVLDLQGLPLEPDFLVAESDHSKCCHKEKCIPYKSVRFPPLKKSLYAETAIWKMEISRIWDVECQQMVKKTADVLVNLFSGNLCDISFSGFPVRDAKIRLMKVLQECSWPDFLARYEGKYPVDGEEYEGFWYGDLQFDWPRSDVDREESESEEDEDDDDEDDEDDEDDDDDDDDDEDNDDDDEDNDDDESDNDF